MQISISIRMILMSKISIYRRVILTIKRIQYQI